VDFEELISASVRIVEALGAAIMVVGGLLFLFVGVIDAAREQTRAGAYEKLRQRLGRTILLGLEVLIIADIIRTIVVDPTLDSVVVLGLIVVIRIILSFSLEVEIDGAWPWNKLRLSRDRGRQLTDGGAEDADRDGGSADQAVSA
jgi:uncharacterized membrane protein